MRKPVNTQNISSGCPTGNKMSTALVVLSKKDLQKREIKQIRFSTGTVADYYDIKIDDKNLELVPKSMVVFKAAHLEGSLQDHMSFSFDGSGRVALHVPMARPDEDVQAAVEKFAIMHALTPDSENPMSLSSSGSPVFHFRDDSGHIAGNIGPEGYSEMGTINVGRPFDGPTGRTTTAVPLKVFATRPGTEL